jgi:uncharacterized alpha-E superfamily protein
VLSRHAESFFWLARNVERAETVARVLDVTYTRSMDRFQHDVWANRAWRTALAIGTLAEPANVDTCDAETAFDRCIFDATNLSSIASTVSIARTNAINVRSELSTETWENINELYLDVRAQTIEAVTREGPARFLRRVRDRCQAIEGVTDATLLHVDGWNFLQLGRFAERGYLALRMLATIESLDDPWPEWQALLEMASASMPFARASSHLPASREVVDFVLFDPTFPRSVGFCANEVDAALHRISETPQGRGYTNQAEKLAGRLCAEFNFADVADVLHEGLHPFVRRVRHEIEDLMGAIQGVYFPRIPVPNAPLLPVEVVSA